MLGAAARGPANSEPSPPAPPIFVSPARALGSTRAEFRYDLVAAYSPVRFRAEALPDGLQFNPQTGQLTGRIARAGEYSARFAATNPAGSTRADIAIHVEEAGMYAVLSAPATCALGSPVEIAYAAFDADGRLDFVDFTDLTAGKSLARIPAPELDKRSWQGTFRVAFSTPGTHSILLRTVCFDPNKAQRYSFVDHQCEIDVAP